MSQGKTVRVIIVGLGRVGRAVVRQIHRLARRPGEPDIPPVTVVGLVDHHGYLIARDGLSNTIVQSALAACEAGHSLAVVSGRTAGQPDWRSLFDRDVVFVDTTPAPEMERAWLAALQEGCGVVLANKLPLCGPWSQARLLFEHPAIRYEATVGSSLPIISTASKLRQIGDTVESIEGVLSGTVAYLTAEIARGSTFSEALSRASGLGYTEPDPREDLTGRDAARKALILGRTVGWELEIDDVRVEALLPPHLADTKDDEYRKAIPELDRDLAVRFQEARKNGMTLRFIARIQPRGGVIGLCAVHPESIHGALSGPSNLVAFRSRLYESPLVILGPGSGPERTAAAVVTDILDLASTRW